MISLIFLTLCAPPSNRHDYFYCDCQFAIKTQSTHTQKVPCLITYFTRQKRIILQMQMFVGCNGRLPKCIYLSQIFSINFGYTRCSFNKYRFRRYKHEYAIYFLLDVICQNFFSLELIRSRAKHCSVVCVSCLTTSFNNHSSRLTRTLV